MFTIVLHQTSFYRQFNQKKAEVTKNVSLSEESVSTLIECKILVTRHYVGIVVL